VIEAATLETFGSWGRHVTTAHTLRDAIAALAYWHQKEAPIARTGLGDGGDHAWLWRIRIAKLDHCPGNEPVEQYTLGRLVKVVRLVGGKDWIPTHVKLESRAGESRLSRVLHGCRIEYRQTLLAIAVPWDMLDQPLPRPEPLPPTSVQPGDLQEAHCDFAGSLRQALAPLVTERPLNLALAAELSLVSERSLKRRLAEEGKTWRHVLDQVHLDAALPMLTDTNTSISEIAQRLQYSDHAHFTRAFHRWTGQTPNAFRHRHRHRRVDGPTVE
jgi:AraC-like DNA-binding protein